MRKITSLVLLCIAQLTVGQIHVKLPNKTFKDLEFSKPIKYVKEITYKATDAGYDPVMIKQYTFDTNNQLVQDYFQILGKFSSQTAHNYVYQNNQLDSLNTVASAANFSRKTFFEYNKQGQIIAEKANGHYVDYSRIFTYDKKGNLLSIVTAHQKGGRNWTDFKYKNNTIDFVTQIDGRTKEGTAINYFVYIDEVLFAQWSTANNDLYLFPTPLRHYKIKAAVEPEKTVAKLKQLKLSDKKGYDLALNPVVSQAEIFAETAQSVNDQGDWTARMTKDMRYGQTVRRFVFRKIVYADGTESGSTDFGDFFYRRMKDL